MKIKTKRIIAWIFLFFLIFCLLGINYIKFFENDNPNIKEVPVETSSSKAINNALNEIVTNFNNSKEIDDYAKNNIIIKATLNNYSIFISYTTDKTTTYEFSYNNLILSIDIENKKENLDKFQNIYSILIKSVQKRLGNEENIDTIINSIFEENKIYDGITLEEKENNIINYKMNITKKLKEH